MHAGNVKLKVHPFTQQTVISPTGKECLIYRETGINNSACRGGREDSSVRGQVLKSACKLGMECSQMTLEAPSRLRALGNSGPVWKLRGQFLVFLQ